MKVNYPLHSKEGDNEAFLLALVTTIDKWLSRFSIVVVISTLLAIFCSLLLEVIVRYITKTSLGWPYEIPNIVFPWFVMLGIVLAAQKGMHVSVQLLDRWLPKKINKLIFFLTNLAAAVLFTYLAWVSIEVIETVGIEEFPVTGISASWVYLSMLVGFLGLALTSLTSILKLWCKKESLLDAEGVTK